MRSAFGGASVLELREKVLDRRNGLGLILLLQIQEDPQAILLLAEETWSSLGGRIPAWWKWRSI